MINQQKILAIIPARGGSKGLPGKNIRPLQGMPLVGWPIKAALNSRYIDRVIVTTDDIQIADIAREQGAEVPFIRPAHLALDTSPSSDAILHALDVCTESDGEYGYIVVLEPTSPLTESADIDAALERLILNKGLSIVGVSKVEAANPIFCATIDATQFLKPFNREHFSQPIRRQDTDELYFFDGSLYISDVAHYRKTQTFYHESTLPYVVPAWKSLEIDTLLDFLMVETVLNNKHLLQSE